MEYTFTGICKSHAKTLPLTADNYLALESCDVYYNYRGNVVMGIPRFADGMHGDIEWVVEITVGGEYMYPALQECYSTREAAQLAATT